MTTEELRKKLEELRQGLSELQVQALRQEGAILAVQELIAEAEKATATVEEKVGAAVGT